MKREEEETAPLLASGAPCQYTEEQEEQEEQEQQEGQENVQQSLTRSWLLGWLLAVLSGILFTSNNFLVKEKEKVSVNQTVDSGEILHSGGRGGVDGSLLPPDSPHGSHHW